MHIVLIKDSHPYRHLPAILVIILFFLLTFLFWWFEGEGIYQAELKEYPYYPEPVHELSDFTIADLQQLAKTGSNIQQYRDLSPPFSIPTLSLQSSASAFFGPTGLYSVNEDDPEKQATIQEIQVEMIDTEGQRIFTRSAKASVSGVSTKQLPMKSLNLYLNQPVTSDQIFDHPDAYHLYSLRLRNAGNDFLLAHMRDIVTSELATGTHLIALDYQPVVVMMNNEYWGVQYLRERVDEKTMLGKFPELHRDQVILGELYEQDVYSISNGFDYKLEKLMKLVLDEDLNQTVSYQQLQRALNLDNFVDYMIFQTFISNTDWPHNNVKAVFLDNQLHFILYDADFSMSFVKEYFEHTNDIFSLPERYYHVDEVRHPFLDSIDYYMPTHVGRMHSTLLQYPFYRQKYLRRYRELLRTQLSQERIEETVKHIRQQIEPFMPAHIARWGYPSSKEEWINHTEQIIKFCKARRAFIRKKLEAELQQFRSEIHQESG